MQRKSLSILALALVLAPSIAVAYVQPAEAILAAAAARRAKIGFTTIVAEGTYEQGEQRIPVWEAIKANKAHRVEYRKPDGAEVILTVESRRWRFTGGKSAGQPERVNADLFMTFLARPDLDPGGRLGMLFLKRHGIGEEVSLGRSTDKRVAYVIGAKAWETDKPSLWIDKEILVPLRLITKAEDGALIDIRLIGWGSGSTEEWYPRRVETYRNGQLLDATTYDRATLNATVDASVFEPPS
jgi:hypothetical protein